MVFVERVRGNSPLKSLSGIVACGDSMVACGILCFRFVYDSKVTLNSLRRLRTSSSSLNHEKLTRTTPKGNVPCVL